MRFWLGQTASMFGSRIGVIAVPLTALYVLHASVSQMGLLAAAGSLPVFLVGLIAGVWADRVRRRPLMIAADVGRALLLATVPIAYLFGVLSLAQLLIVIFGVGLLSAFFDAAYGAFLPSVVPRGMLVRANSALEGGDSVAQIAGPGLGGTLVTLFGAPMAMAADALSFVVSVGSLLLMRPIETNPSPENRESFRSELVEGLRVVLDDPILRALAAVTALFNLFDSLLMALYTVYMSQTLHMSSVEMGMVFGLGGLGGLLGAVMAGRLATRVGVGTIMVAGVAVAACAELAIAGTGGAPATATALLVLWEICVELGATVFGVVAASVRQAVTPPPLLGRAGASARTLAVGATPFGGLAAGVLGTALGVRATVAVAGLGTLLAAGWIVASPVRKLVMIPGFADPRSEVR